MSFDLEQMPRDALIRELRKLHEVDLRMNAAGNSDPAVLLRELHLHQIELEVQNRELLEAQLELEDSRSRYADLYNAAPVGIVTLDAHGVLKEMNLTAAALLGGSRESLIGSAFGQRVAPADRRRFWSYLRRCLSEERRVSTELTLVIGERGLNVQLVGSTASAEGGMSCRTSVVDISELKESEARLRLLSEAGRSLACSLDYRSTLGTVVRLAVPLFADVCMLDVVNEGGTVDRIEVIAANDAMQRDVESLLQRPVARAAQHALQRAVIASGHAALFEQRPESRSGLEAETAALWDTLAATTMLVVPASARGHTLGALTFVTTTSRRRFQQSDVAFAEELTRRAAIAIDNALLYDQAQRAVHARENLLAIVSHDLQNPLSVILMRASAMRDDPGLDDSTQEDIAAIQRAAQGMSTLIEDLLDLASIDAGSLSMRVQTVPLVTLIEETVAQQQPLATSREVSLKCNLPAEQIEVRCDSGRVTQVLTNLLSNALKFTPPGGRITVSTECQNDEVCVAVADTGCGITPTQLPRIFDRYWQAESGRVGTGLGLSICKAIVDELRGRIWAESVPGEGATLYFTLPLAARKSLPSGVW